MVVFPSNTLVTNKKILFKNTFYICFIAQKLTHFHFDFRPKTSRAPRYRYVTRMRPRCSAYVLYFYISFCNTEMTTKYHEADQKNSMDIRFACSPQRMAARLFQWVGWLCVCPYGARAAWLLVEQH